MRGASFDMDMDRSVRDVHVSWVAAKMASYVFKLWRVQSAMHFADISVWSSKWNFEIKVTNASECNVN